MGLDSWMTAKPGGFESAQVFAQTPFRSRQFLAVTVVVIAAILLDIIAIVRLYGQVHWSALLILLLGLMTVLGNWLRVRVVHQRLHELYVAAASGRLLQEPPVDTALRASATLCYWGTLAAAVAGTAGPACVLEILMHAR